MLASALISDTIPPLRTSDTGIKALNWMDEFKVSHLPIVNNHELLGVVSDTDILDLNAPEEPLGNHPLSLFRPFVYENEHIYEVLKLVAKMQLTIVPVLDAENNYLGNISLRSLVEHFADMTAVTNPGGVIILELNAHDFVLSQIARIVEENDAKILSLYIDEISDSTRLELTIKVNREDIRGILQSFARHNIPVKAT
ncbi:MAG: CBS domain-containing protein, partial [Bacteroidia bacterium]|nr:CBS domain-containing protein [Bacteroidia bacterium]